jgi:hypothetical protein
MGAIKSHAEQSVFKELIREINLSNSDTVEFQLRKNVFAGC